MTLPKKLEEIDKVISQIEGIAQPVSVFVYDSGNPPFTAGGWGVPNLIVECAGGRNIFLIYLRSGPR